MNDIHDLIERAFDYRGYVTLSRTDGTRLVAYVYDRSATHVELLDERGHTRIRLPISEIANIELTGEDSAAKAQRIWERRRGDLEPRETSVWGDWEQRPVLVMTALPIELAPIAGNPVVVRTIGVGGGVAKMIASERPRLVISCGFAGGLDPRLAANAVVLATAVTDEAGETFVAPERVRTLACEALYGLAVEGEILCATRVAATPAEKRALARPGRLAIDLESAAIARASERAGIPWLALRAIVDPVDVALPAFVREQRRTYVAPALRHALRGPRAMFELADLAVRARRARRVLGVAVRWIARELAEAQP